VQEIYEKFVDILGEPSSRDYLNDYISFVIKNETNKSLSEYYCEDHHIIPSSIYKNDNTYTLKYTDHIEAHVLLAKAYPISKFIRPLNFMLSRTEKESIEFRRLISISAKENFKKFRKSDRYPFWVAEQRKRTRDRMLSGQAKSMSLLGNTEDLKKQKSDFMRQWWTDERKLQKSKDLIEYNKINGTQRYTDALNKRYESMTEEERQNFREIMQKVNNSEDKKADAKIKLKALWSDDEHYKAKMQNRKTRGSDGSKTSEMWKNEELKSKILVSRKLSTIKRNAALYGIEKEIKLLSDDEILKKYDYCSVKPQAIRNKNSELSSRIQIDIIKEYKKNFKIKKDEKTARGWYRLSVSKLNLIIIEYSNKYGIVEKYKNQIKEIVDETN